MKPRTFVFTLAAAAIITGAGAGFASADAADQGANDSSYSSQHGRDPGDRSCGDRDQGGMGTSEQSYDSRWFSSSGYGPNDEQADATRALNNEQLANRGRVDDDDMQGPSDDDNDDSRDKASSPDRD
jgi:hypothetical protein